MASIWRATVGTSFLDISANTLSVTYLYHKMLFGNLDPGMYIFRGNNFFLPCSEKSFYAII